MPDLPRLLAIMGSGETAPTMAKVHRRLLARLPAPPNAVLLDTPYGFQENAADISERTRVYFRHNLGASMEIASWRFPEDASAAQGALARIRAADYVFAGPGSPTYALRVWAGSLLPDVLREKLTRGGCVTFSSAAALTLGVVTLPVYEVYKCGQAPRWVPGLDLLAGFGLRVAVIPHFDNAEGRTHDTRFCYLGERRLRVLEAELPGEAFVLGVDEHTACVFDLDAGTVDVLGLGHLTVRRDGASAAYPSGTTIDIETIARAAAPKPPARSAAPPSPAVPAAGHEPMSLRAEADRLESCFHSALATGDTAAAASAVLDLTRTILDWFADTEADDLSWAQVVLRRALTRLTEGHIDPMAAIAPFVDALVWVRDRARAEQAWDLADAIRHRLVEAGVEVHDRPEGSDWTLRCTEPTGRTSPGT